MTDQSPTPPRCDPSGYETNPDGSYICGWLPELRRTKRGETKVSDAVDLSDLQAQLAARPDDPQLIEAVRAETARVLGERDVLPADGSPSENQKIAAQKRIDEINAAFLKPGLTKEESEALIAEKIALCRIT